MALRFFADHCISNAIVQTLRAAGHEVLRLKDYLPVESADSIVIAKAKELDAFLTVGFLAPGNTIQMSNEGRIHKVGAIKSRCEI